MSREKKYSNTLRVRIDSKLLEDVKDKADNLNTDVSTFVRWCISTGLYLNDLNKFIRLKIDEDDEDNEE